MFHSGTLDNFSSFILLNPKQNYGIVVLANLNSEYVPKLVEHLNTQIVNHKRYSTVASMLNQYKNQFNIVTVLMTTLILLAFIFSAYRAWQMRHGKIILRKSKLTTFSSWLTLCLCIAIALILYALPYLILGSNNWSFVLTWLPIEIKLALITILIALFSTLIVILLFLHTKITKIIKKTCSSRAFDNISSTIRPSLYSLYIKRINYYLIGFMPSFQVL